MNNLDGLKRIYSKFLFGAAEISDLKSWALGQIMHTEDEDVYLLASSIDEDEAIELVEGLLEKEALLSDIKTDNVTLIKKVYDNFPIHSRPENVTIYKERTEEGYLIGDGHVVQDFFGGKNWDEIDMVNTGNFAFGFLNAEAIRYYLPTFLVSILSNENITSVLADSVFEFFASENDLTKSLIKSLNPSQLKTFVQVLRYVRMQTSDYIEESKKVYELLSGQLNEMPA